MRRGVPGALECVTCFEPSCFGCALIAPPIGVCPVCGRDVRLDDSYEWRGGDLVHWDCLDDEQYSEEVDHCPKCGSWKGAGDILCRSCRDSLAKRFTDFADFLTAEEEEQLDEWLDGRSVTDRRSFE